MHLENLTVTHMCRMPNGLDAAGVRDAILAEVRRNREQVAPGPTIDHAAASMLEQAVELAERAETLAEEARQLAKEARALIEQVQKDHR